MGTTNAHYIDLTFEFCIFGFAAGLLKLQIYSLPNCFNPQNEQRLKLVNGEREREREREKERERERERERGCTSSFVKLC